MPSDGDILLFDDQFTDSTYSYVNDTTTKFGGAINKSGSITISGNGVTLEGDAVWLETNDSTFYINKLRAEDNLFAESELLINSYQLPDVKILGNLVYVSGSSTIGHYFPPKGSVGGIVIQKGNYLKTDYSNPDSQDVSYPVTFGGGTGYTPYIIYGNPSSGGVVSGRAVSGRANGPVDSKLSKVILNSDAYLKIEGPDSVTIKSLVKNGHTLKLSTDSTGKLTLPSGVVENTETMTKLAGNKPSEGYGVRANETAVLDGTRGAIYVVGNGTLKGNGTVESLYLHSLATLSPGNSPGKITVKDEFLLGKNATYVAEIYNADAYDQVVAKSVSIDGAVLNLKFLSGAKVNKGDEFRIINNTGSDPIDGKFDGLAQGSKITIGKAVFAVDYKGGTGNDVVLTALSTASAAGAPNTGFVARVTANPAIVAGLGLLTVILMALLGKTLSTKKS